MSGTMNPARKKAIDNSEKTYRHYCKMCKKETNFYTKSTQYKKGKDKGGRCTECAARCEKERIKRKKEEDPVEYRKNKRKQQFRDVYNITEVQVMQMYDAQGGICADPNCNFTFTDEWWNQGKGTGFCIDHDHETEIIRGLVCTTCNLIEGMIRNHPEKIEGMKEYKQAGGFPFPFQKFSTIKKVSHTFS